MNEQKQTWSAAVAAMQAFAPFYQEGTRRVLQNSGVANDWFALYLARSAEPEPFTLPRFQAMSPYNDRTQQAGALARLAEKGMLVAISEDAYRLTEAGRSVAASFFQAAHEGLATIEPLPAADMARLNMLLRRIVEATLSSPEPQPQYALCGSRWTDPGADGAPAAIADQYITDLYYYRDDAHLASWRPYDVSGHAWEALTLIWRDQAGTAAELAESLPNRGHTAERYAEALQQLATRGWLEEVDGRYCLTAEARQVREAAEAETDRYFYIGWSALSQVEVVELGHLLSRLGDNLQQAALKRLWPLANSVSQAISVVTRAPVNPILAQHFSDGRLFPVTQWARGIAPEPLAAGHFSRRYPYINPHTVNDRLNQASEAGLLKRQGDGNFTVSERGQLAIDSANDVFYRYLTDLDTLPAEDLETLANLLDRVVHTSLEAAEPGDKWALANIHRFHPDVAYGPLTRIDQHLDDLNAFRDDAHLAAWQPYEIDGRSWETFTFAWRGEAQTAEELAQKLPNRGYSAGDYAASLAELVERGWLAEVNGRYRPTEEGQRLRQTVEEATDHYFYAPWAGLDQNDQARLRHLLIQLKLKLEQLAETE